MSNLETNETGTRWLRIAEVVEAVGLSRATVYRLIESDGFPKPVKLSPKRVAWLRSEVEAWLETRIGERDE